MAAVKAYEDLLKVLLAAALRVSRPPKQQNVFFRDLLRTLLAAVKAFQGPRGILLAAVKTPP